MFLFKKNLNLSFRINGTPQQTVSAILRRLITSSAFKSQSFIYKIGDGADQILEVWSVEF